MIMAMFTWIGNLTGNWDNEDNWYNNTDSSYHDGYPGAGDTVDVNATTVTVSGDTVAVLNAFGTDIVGNITVTDLIEDGVFSGGNVSAGTVGVGYFHGLSLTADTFDQGVLYAGTATINVADAAAVEGATVKVQSIKRDPSGGTHATNCNCSIASGSLTAGTMTLVGAFAGYSPDSFYIGGGTATVTGAATATGAGVAISSDGGTLQFSDGLKLSDGAQLTVNGKGAKVKDIKSLIDGNSGAGTVLIENGGEVTASTLWDGSSSSSSQGTGTITVSSGGVGV
jgi:T5SS/PEP-CTERM-associated repeat protein